jgi:hypothetical protein
MVAFSSGIFTFQNWHVYEYIEKYSRCRSIGRHQKLPSAYWRLYTVHLASNPYVQKSAFLSFHWNFEADSLLFSRTASGLFRAVPGKRKEELY